MRRNRTSGSRTSYSVTTGTRSCKLTTVDQHPKRLAARTRDVYNRHGEQFDRERARVLVEKDWLDRFANMLPPGGAVLDAGCGAGEPIARYLVEQGFDVTGIDFSETMIDIVASRFPDHRWIVSDIRDLDLNRQFHGVIGWHSFFHLTPNEQRGALAGLANHLAAGGVMMLTVGPTAGETVGHVCGDPVYHSSLSIAEYTRVLDDLGMTIVRFVPEDPACDLASVLLARKQG